MRSILLLAVPVALAAVILAAAGGRGMSAFKKQGVAWALTLAMIAAAVGIGQAKASAAASPTPEPEPGLLDNSLDTSNYTRFIDDRAGVLNGSAEKQLALYLANWDARYHSVVAFASVSRVNGGTEDYADDAFMDFGLEDGDALLLVVGADDDYQFVWGDEFGSIMTDRAADRLVSALGGGSWQEGVLRFYAALNGIYVENFGLGDGTQGDPNPGPVQTGHRVSAVPALITLLVFVVILVLLLSAIDRGRYHAYRRQYYGVVNPPVVFRPIFFWHGPRSSWYRRNWRRPPPPPPPAGPRGPGSFGGTPPRPPSGGGSRPSGGFGGSRGSSRPGGSFGGTRPGGSFGGTRSGGSFGGSRSRGSFGGSRPSGGFGGSRGGGGRSGGSFGGRR